MKVGFEPAGIESKFTQITRFMSLLCNVLAG